MLDVNLEDAHGRSSGYPRHAPATRASPGAVHCRRVLGRLARAAPACRLLRGEGRGHGPDPRARLGATRNRDTANAVSPGSTRTPILEEGARLYGLAGAEAFAVQQPIERLLHPEGWLHWSRGWPVQPGAGSPEPISPSTAVCRCDAVAPGPPAGPGSKGLAWSSRDAHRRHAEAHHAPVRGRLACARSARERERSVDSRPPAGPPADRYGPRSSQARAPCIDRRGHGGRPRTGSAKAAPALPPGARGGHPDRGGGRRVPGPRGCPGGCEGPPCGGPASPVPGGSRRCSEHGPHTREDQLVAFLDSDCVPSEGWLGALTGHFEDPLVAAVGPRVRPLEVPGRTLLSRLPGGPLTARPRTRRSPGRARYSDLVAADGGPGGPLERAGRALRREPAPR